MPISFEQVSYIYQDNTPFAFQGLHNVSFTIEKGDYVSLIGHTGSGKSTLIQHLNALLKATSGQVIIDDFKITAETLEKNLKPLRQKVGVVFQFPEAQLFDETILKDVMFGPLNFGVSKEEAQTRAIQALKLVGIDEALFDRSPFDLSGGQMRRVAIAGILAVQPDVLVLDEPTAGLDPKTRIEMMALFKQLHETYHMTIILVTHQMDDVANFANKVLVMSKGELCKVGTPLEIFKQVDWLKEHHIELPSAMQMANRLRQKGVLLDDNILTSDQLIQNLAIKLGGTNVR